MYLRAPDAMRGRGCDSRYLSADAPPRLPPRVIQRPRHSIGAAGLQIAHYIAVEPPCMAHPKLVYRMAGIGARLSTQCRSGRSAFQP
jgi:hypothetical protein